MAKNPGKKFEEDFVNSIPDRCDVTRLKDAGGWSNATNMRFTSSNPCDFIVYGQPQGNDYGSMYKIELKSTLGKSLPLGNIKEHQLESLVASERKGVLADFIVNFRDVNETYRASALQIKIFIDKTDRKSIPLSWFREQCQLVKQELIRVRWRYDLEWL